MSSWLEYTACSRRLPEPRQHGFDIRGEQPGQADAGTEPKERSHVSPLFLAGDGLGHGVLRSTMSRFMSGGGLSMEYLDALADLLDLHLAAGKQPKKKG